MRVLEKTVKIELNRLRKKKAKLRLGLYSPLGLGNPFYYGDVRQRISVLVNGAPCARDRIAFGREGIAREGGRCRQRVRARRDPRARDRGRRVGAAAPRDLALADRAAGGARLDRADGDDHRASSTTAPGPCSAGHQGQAQAETRLAIRTCYLTVS